ncbi:hypothetical protein XM38_015080 [Halomicronema hongdechloris C2206]|uniref:(2Fe-2S) ferredoxin domain-containing protein n=1 Tax=Halomicronema hongdechloris C2206 TaxID=1641165 RepID=A0A1Z3HJT8_9CYAN|nr:(2Fe-2S) ferredoxin domain-containing protein [Halomicronema hongdechloris]ASC70568.1 hypothetical protein XM38_015080 [Halomicronema hongdechloris C2206]
MTQYADRLRHQGILQGTYVADIRSDHGKLKGIRLQTPQGTYAVKLPKPLRYAIARELTLGAPVRVWVRSKKDSLKAIQVIPLTPQTALELPPEPASVSPRQAHRIQVCGKGSCCKRGGNALWQALKQVDAERSDIALERTGCLKHCKHGPNLRIGKTLHSRVSPAQLPMLLQRHCPQAETSPYPVSGPTHS